MRRSCCGGDFLPVWAAPILAALAWALAPCTASAHAVTVDGDAGDWLPLPPRFDNVGQFVVQGGAAELVLFDAAFDERILFADPPFAGPPAPEGDILDVRLTADATRLYFLFGFGDGLTVAAGDGVAQVQIAVDMNVDSHTGSTSFAGFADTLVDDAARWEFLIQTRFGAGPTGAGVWSEGFASFVADPGWAVLNESDDRVEIGIPWAALGGVVPAAPIRFTISVYRANAVDDTFDEAGPSVSDAIDVVASYGLPGSPQASTADEVSDGVVSYYFDVGFASDGDPVPDLLINEVDYDQGDPDTEEFIEIAVPDGFQVTPLEVLFFDGGGAGIYGSIAVPGAQLAPGYFVICGDAANVSPCHLDAPQSVDLVQDGSPDAIALWRQGIVHDAVSYEGDAPAPFTEQSGVGLEDPPTPNLGISRIPDLADTNLNNADFVPAPITPGAPNMLSASVPALPGAGAWWIALASLLGLAAALGARITRSGENRP